MSPLPLPQAYPLAGVLESEQCFQCRRCCIFHPDEADYAPRFTETTWQAAVRRFTPPAPGFRSCCSLRQPELQPLPDDPSGRAICPFYDLPTARCGVYADRPFDCVVWPFYVMRTDRGVAIAVSEYCEAVAAGDVPSLRARLSDPLISYMIAETRKCPDLIVGYRADARVLLDVTEADEDPGD